MPTDGAPGGAGGVVAAQERGAQGARSAVSSGSIGSTADVSSGLRPAIRGVVGGLSEDHARRTLGAG